MAFTYINKKVARNATKFKVCRLSAFRQTKVLDRGRCSRAIPTLPVAPVTMTAALTSVHHVDTKHTKKRYTGWVWAAVRFLWETKTHRSY